MDVISPTLPLYLLPLTRTLSLTLMGVDRVGSGGAGFVHWHAKPVMLRYVAEAGCCLDQLHAIMHAAGSSCRLRA